MPARLALRELRGGRIRSLPTIAIVASLQRQQSVTETLGRSPTGVLKLWRRARNHQAAPPQGFHLVSASA